MRLTTTIRTGLPLLATAVITLTGCAGAVGDPTAQPGAEAPAAAKAEPTAAKAEPRQALQEVEAPASAKQHEPIAAADAATLAERSAAASANDTIHICTFCNLLPDLKVVEDDRDQWHCDPAYGCYWAYARGFDIQNIGAGNAPGFHVAVLQGSDSYGFDVPGLAAGASMYFQITQPSYLGPACGVTAVVLVNPFNAIAESNYNNNAANVPGLCLL
jgi:hypothetical protein